MKKKAVNPYVIEAIAMLERTLNFGHTGNASVLIRKLMGPARLSMGCLTDGLPCIADTFIRHQSIKIKDLQVVSDNWPVVNRGTRQPHTASKRVLQLTYGDKFCEVCLTHTMSFLL